MAVIWLAPTVLLFRWIKRRGARKEERNREKEAERVLALALLGGGSLVDSSRK